MSVAILYRTLHLRITNLRFEAIINEKTKIFIDQTANTNPFNRHKGVYRCRCFELNNGRVGAYGESGHYERSA